MSSINMIATRWAERKRLEKIIRITFLIIAVELASAFFLFGFMATQIFSAGIEIDRLDRKLAEIRPTVDQIERYQAEIKALAPRLELLADSHEQTLIWYGILQTLGREMPDSAWLTGLSTTKPSGPGSGGSAAQTVLNLRGLSTSQSVVGEAMLRLSQYPLIDRVDLAYTQGSNGRQRECVEFQLSASLKPRKQSETGDVQNASN